MIFAFFIGHPSETLIFEESASVRNYYGQETKIIIWEHNTHIGDASETSMKDEQMINVGQVIREQCGKENTYAIGFGTYEGTVIAADRWGGRKMPRGSRLAGN